MNYADKLSSFAAWLRKRPDLLGAISDWEYPSMYLYFNERRAEDFSNLCKAMGSFEKDGRDGEIRAIVEKKITNEDDDFGGTKFRMVLALSGACERIEKTDPETGEVITRPVKRYTMVDTGETEPEYEWKCPDSFLNLGANNEHSS